MNNKFAIYFIFSITVVGVIALAALFYVKHQGSNTAYAPTNTPNQVLMKENQNFNSAKAFQKQGDYKQALSYYQKALPEAADLTQEAQIKYDIAYMTELDGDHLGAIKLFKDIAANPAYYPLVRAYSVEEIGLMYGWYGDSQAIEVETFKDAPYSTFLSNNDVPLAYRKLYEYANSMYPLGMAEGRVAKWYSNDLRTSLRGATTTLQGQAELATIHSDLALAQDDVARIKNNPYESSNIPDIYLREALAYEDLQMVGASSPTEVEAFFSHAESTGAALGLPIPFTNLYHANFLATQYKGARADDIKNLLSVYSSSNAKNLHPSVVTFFVAAKKPTAQGSVGSLRSMLIRLSLIDLDFKSYLVSLGWKKSDF